MTSKFHKKTEYTVLRVIINLYLPEAFNRRKRGKSYFPSSSPSPARGEFSTRKLEKQSSCSVWIWNRKSVDWNICILRAYCFYNKTVRSITLVRLHGSWSSATVFFNLLFLSRPHFFASDQVTQKRIDRGKTSGLWSRHVTELDPLSWFPLFLREKKKENRKWQTKKQT